MPQNLSAQIVCFKPKNWNFDGKKASFGVRSPCIKRQSKGGKNTSEKEKYIAKKFGMEESFNFSWMIDKYPWKNDIKTMYVVLVFCFQNCSDLL